MYLGQKIKRQREKLLLSQNDLATLVGVTRQTVYYWESGRRKPSLTKSRMLASILQMGFGEFTRKDKHGNYKRICDIEQNQCE